MKKYILCISISLMFLLPCRVYATDYKQAVEDIADEYDIKQEEIYSISVADIIEYISEQISLHRKEPVKLVAKLSGIIFITAVLKALYRKSDMMDAATDSVSIITVFIALLTPMQNVISIISENLIQIRNFIVSFLPIYAGISLASGEIITSSIYSGFFLSGIVFISDLCINTVLPSVQLYFALVISNALSPFIKLKSVCELFIKIVRWIMRGIVSVICFVLTLQTAISRGSDSLAVKTGKVIAGTMVPVIGSALQDAVGSVYAGMEAIKGFAGVVGIIVVLNIFVPSIVLLFTYWLCVNVLFVLCEISELKSLGECIKGFSNATELILSIIFLFIVLLVFSLTIMISLTNGV